MRHSVVWSGAIAAGITLSCITASAQENNNFTMAKPLAAPSNALELKIGSGYTEGFGNLAPGRTIRDVAGAGIGAGLDVDYRLNPHWSIGVEGQYQQFNNQQNTSSRGLAGNLGATYHFAPAQVGDPWVRLGTGYRLLWESDPLGTSAVVLRHGFELANLKLGYDVRVSEDVGIAPIIGADLTTFLWQNNDGSTANQTLPKAEVGTFVYAGLQGRFDIGGSRVGGAVVEPAPVFPTAAEVPPPAPPPPPAPAPAPAPQPETTPVAPSVAVSADILRDCELKLGSVDQAPKFEFNKAELVSADYDILSQIATCFTTGPMKGQSIDLVGRADPRGTVAYNEVLGLKRAKAVETYLENKGVDQSMISTTSRGKLDAVGHDDASWARDRRVDVLSR